MEIIFLLFIQTGKILTPIECDKLCTYVVIPITTHKKTIQSNILKIL